MAPTFGLIEQSRVGPISLHHDREPKLGQPEEGYYEVRKNSRKERTEKGEHPDRGERHEKGTDEDRSDHKRGKHTMPSLAAVSADDAVLGIKAVKSASGSSRDDRNNRDEQGRDYDEEPRRRDKDDRESVDLTGRDPKEKQPRNDDLPPPPGPPPRGVEVGDPVYPIIDLTGRNPRERKSSPARRESRLKPISTVAAGAFNLKDVMDLKALKEALNSKETAPKIAPKEPARTPRESSKDPEDAEIKEAFCRPRNRATENNQPRIVSLPREKVEKKPVKGILRAPHKFPEDPILIREGVAPRKDAKEDGIPPNARWTKIPRKLVNPEALEAGKERFEVIKDFVIVLRVLSRRQVQGYAELTDKIRGSFYLQY
jgi:hypothetical protein